jgi:type II secretory pathway component PulF
MISTKRLAEFCRRAAMSLHAGLDVRQVFHREATIGPSTQRQRMADISRRVDAGEALGEAIAAQKYFPPLALELINVGEQTGKLERVLKQLAEHYENLLSLRRVFLAGMAWPALQLLISVLIIGALITILGVIADSNGGQGFEMLGIGIGARGLWNFLNILVLLGLIIMTPIVLVRRGFLWTEPLMRILLRVPLIGPCLQCLAMSRLSWALSMAIDAGLSATHSVDLALRASQNPYYAAAWPAVEKVMQRRGTMADALRASERFPEEFLMVLETGELSGMVSEALDRHAEDLRSRAQALLRTLTVVAGTLCSLLVMALIAAVILRMGLSYMDMLNNAGKF